MEQDGPSPDVRKQLSSFLDGESKQAAASWKEADAALSRALKSSDRAARVPAEVGVGRIFGTTPAVTTGEAKSAVEPCYKSITQRLFETGQKSQGVTIRASRVAARSGAFDHRGKLMRIKSQDCKEKLSDHKKRLLRSKIASLLDEVRRRRDFHQKQIKARKQREKIGRPPAADVGEATKIAIGLVGLPSTDPLEQAQASPRRACILESLTLDELDLLRRDPRYYLTKPAVAAAEAKPSTVMAADDEDPWGINAKEDADPMESIEDLVDFFTPSRHDRDQKVEAYARSLRTQITPGMKTDVLANVDYTGNTNIWPQSSQSLSTKGAGSPTAGISRSVSSSASAPVLPTFSEPVEMMPCLGRQPAVRSDELSPTLARVREVYNRRDAADARWVEEKREGMERRLAQNAFKAREQQRETQLQIFQQKELHKVRMLEAEERKAVFDAETKARMGLRGDVKSFRQELAAERAEDATETRRETARATLAKWEYGVHRSTNHLRRHEINTLRSATAKWDEYNHKLMSLAAKRHKLPDQPLPASSPQYGHDTLARSDPTSSRIAQWEDKQEQLRGELSKETMSQKNDALRNKLKASVLAQREELRLQQSAELAKSIETKLAAAERRRQRGPLHMRYNLVEKALGNEALDFDVKHHSVAVDRRGESWQKSAEEWAQERAVFNAAPVEKLN